MDIQDALAGIAVYNSMTTYPLLAVKGFSIYLQEGKTIEQKERMIKYLNDFSDQFADVVIGYQKGNRDVMLKNVIVYDGIASIAKNHPDVVKDIASNLEELKLGIGLIIRGDKVPHEVVRAYVNRAMNILDVSEKNISGSTYENYLFGNPAANY